MTVKELKERLDEFPDNCIVVIPNVDYDPTCRWSLPYSVALNATRGCNEFDGIVLIDDYMEDDENEV